MVLLNVVVLVVSIVDMRSSRGMGDIAPSKMPKGKKIIRKDDPNAVEIYKKGGVAKSFPPLTKNKRAKK
jgi:hypothetical protein